MWYRWLQISRLQDWKKVQNLPEFSLSRSLIPLPTSLRLYSNIFTFLPAILRILSCRRVSLTKYLQGDGAEIGLGSWKLGVFQYPIACLAEHGLYFEFRSLNMRRGSVVTTVIIQQLDLPWTTLEDLSLRQTPPNASFHPGSNYQLSRPLGSDQIQSSAR